MTSPRATILAALVAALGLATMSTAFAAGPQHQQQPPRQNFDQRDGRMLDFRRDGMGGTFRLAEVTCAPRAADRLEARLDRLAGRLDLTADQQQLFDDFRTSALTAQTGFADQCADLRPGREAERGDLVTRLEQKLKFDEARLAAMTDILPDFKAFYEGLTDQQKSELMPRRAHVGMQMPDRGGPQHGKPMPAPAQPE